MIRIPCPTSLRRAAVSIAAAALALSTVLAVLPPAVARADMLTARISSIDLSVPPRVEVEAFTRPEAEQGQILYGRRSRVAPMDVQALERALGSLAPGTPVRLGLPGGDRALEGSYFRLGRDAVHVETRGGPVELDRSGIHRVWVGRPQTGKGALIGAINGFAFGTLMGAVNSSDFEERYADGTSRASRRSNLEEIGQLTFHWGLPVALIGAAVGAVIGSGVTGWQPATP